MGNGIERTMEAYSNETLERWVKDQEEYHYPKNSLGYANAELAKKELERRAVAHTKLGKVLE